METAVFWNFTLRLAVAALLGLVVGIDREYRAKEAGMRTHFLVSLGSALIMIVSQWGFGEILAYPNVSLDPSRVAAGIVTGIGFIGAGTIIIQKQFVRGLTTAAGLWATAAIGMAIGSGMYAIGAVATVLTLVGLELSTLWFGKLGIHNTLLIYSTGDQENLKRILTEIHQKGYHVVSYDVDNRQMGDLRSYRATVVLKMKREENKNRLVLFLQELPGLTVEKIE